MNGFQLMADSYRKAAEKGLISKEQANKDCRIFDFLATCDQEDICNLYNSSAFNDIAKGYLRIALSELQDEGVIDSEQAEAVRGRFRFLHDEKQAQQVLS